MNVVDFLRPSEWMGSSRGPRYVQLRRRLEEGIAKGILPLNSSLPSEREIAEITDLSRVTVRNAIQELVQEGFIEQRQGSGSFIREPVARMEQSLTQLSSFTEDMAQRGLETTSQWLERGIFKATAGELTVLDLHDGAEVSRVYRLREAGGRPMALEKASLPIDILPNPLEVSSSLYAVLDRLGNRPVRAVQKISAINLEPREANLLGVAEGVAGLSIERTSFLTSGRVVELTRSIYRGDAYEFIAELHL